MPELENSQFITMEVLKEMLAMQKDSYQMSVKMLVEDIRQEVRDIRKEVQELSTSVSFLNAKYDDIKDDIGKIETRVNAAFIQMEAMHKDVNADFETIITNMTTSKINRDAITLRYSEFLKIQTKRHGTIQNLL